VTAPGQDPVCGAAAAGCGCAGNPVFDGMSRQYRAVLWVVIAINAAMFVVEIVFGGLSGSRSLQADALDFLGDTATYGLSLAVIGRSRTFRSGAALVKGLSLLAMGLWVFGATAIAFFSAQTPEAPVMGAVGILALAANLASVALLVRFKDGDANVRSVWLCSRNDAIGNVAVIGAAVAVALTGSALPDLVVAGAMSALFLRSAGQILRQALAELRASGRGETAGEGACGASAGHRH